MPFSPYLAQLLQYSHQAPRQMLEELQLTDARGRGFESCLCRQRWQSSSEDRARNNFSTSSCQSAPTGGCRQDYIVWKQRVRLPPPETAKSCQSSRPPFFRYGRQMPWETTVNPRVAGSNPAPLQAGSSVGRASAVSQKPSCPPYPLFTAAGGCLKRLH